MFPAEFKTKWQRFSGKETAAYQEHFNDLCRLLGQPTPAEADPTGNDTFCFQKFVLKDAELFSLIPSDKLTKEAEQRGFADVWKAGCFAWEYKGKRKNLDEAYKQLLRYRESLLNPPLLVVCDFDRYIIRTNFNGTVQETHEFTNAEIDTPRAQRLLRALFTRPDDLKPQRTTAQVTEKLASQIAEIARSLQGRESVEYHDAANRRAVYVAQRKNLRIARFLNRVIFCLFAEDTGLLPDDLFSEVARTGLDDPQLFAESLEDLFKAMSQGGRFGQHKIRHFNGHLFEEATVFALTAEELRQLADAAEADWQAIEPSIMGTLFERALEPEQRSQLGAHYTSEADIKMLVEPVLMAPLRREWSEIKASLVPTIGSKKSDTKTIATQAEQLRAFQDKLTAITVLDPACGSGNFLYVSLQLLLGLEKEVLAQAEQIGRSLAGPKVSVQQLRALEINPYAFELAQVAVQIGYLQWRRDNGFDNERSPVLQNLEGFENKDALLNQTFRKRAKDLKEAQAEEHAQDEDTVKVYTERAWPECDVLVGNPPFLGDKLMRGQLGGVYVDELRRVYGDRIPGQSDLCCYWFEKARDAIEHRRCRRAGLLATQAIRGGANREVLKRIKDTGDIFFAESDREWILAGATVHVSMVGFDASLEQARMFDGKAVAAIAANLTAATDLTVSAGLEANKGVGFIGVSMHGPFDMDEAMAVALLSGGGNPHGKPNSDVLRPVLNAQEIVKRSEGRWLVSFPTDISIEEAAGYAAPMAFVQTHVFPLRSVNHRKTYRDRWWLPGEARPAMQNLLGKLPRFLTTPRVSKHRIFAWVSPEYLPSDATVAFARADDYFFGILHSRFHEVWALAQGTQLRDKESGFRYTPTTCFESFPFPSTAPQHEAAVADAAHELNAMRGRWLNPPEWMAERTLEFPGSVAGPWARYIHNSEPHGIGMARYPRLESRDAASAKKLTERTLTKLYNERPAWLDLAHKKLDTAVAAAYGWPEGLSNDETLARLLKLNLARAAEEAVASKAAVLAGGSGPSKLRPSRAKTAEEML